MLGGFLVDSASADVKNAAGLQSVANTAKNAGSLAASIAGLYIYASSPAALGTRAAIAFTAVGPGLIVASMFFLKEPPRTGERVAFDGNTLRFGVSILVVQAFLVIISLQNLISYWKIWIICTAVVCSLTLFAM